LLSRGADHVAGCPDPSPGVDPAVFDPHYIAAQAADLAQRISRDGLSALPETDLRLKLNSR
jgi:hypothetical protein